ncbi:BLUF domain-containing protein [Marinobacter sp.]|uniref:BLUF domain-containing protein n=1 Tax=Marinobacter sp. TaxID=50741 RepID=UPI00384D035B
MDDPALNVRLIYYSYRVSGADSREIEDILTISLERNAKEGITGMLAYSEDFFMQLLEGTAGPVNDLYAGIMGDHRHNRLRLIEYGPAPQKRFTNWAMGVAKLPGFLGTYINRLHGGFYPPAFSPREAREFLEIIRDFQEQAYPAD